MPRFGHLPYVMGEGNKKLSKRDPESNLFHHRDRGFIPEGLVNYLALLGWGFSADRDVFSRDELVAAFDVVDVNPNPARFDLKKAESINGDHIRLLDVDDFAARTVPYLQAAGAVVDADHRRRSRRSSSRPRRSCRSASACSARRPACWASSSPTAAGLEYDEAAVGALPADAGAVLAAAREALDRLPADSWTHDRDRGGAARRPHRRPRAQAARRVRPAAHRGLGPARLAAAVRVDGDPRQGRLPRTASTGSPSSSAERAVGRGARRAYRATAPRPASLAQFGRGGAVGYS